MEPPNHWTTRKLSSKVTSINTSSDLIKDQQFASNANNPSTPKLTQLHRKDSMSAQGVSLTPTTPGFASASAGGGYFSYNSGTPAAPKKSGKENGHIEESERSSAGITNGGGAVPTNEIHPLHYTWVFWFMHRPPGSKILNYESSMKRIAAFGSVEDFWAVYSHLRRPHELPNVSDYHLFKQGVRPVWEDDNNVNGGKWIVRLKKGVVGRYWEDLILAIIGDQFAEASEEVCGAVLSVRNGEDIISIWTRNDGGRVLKIRETMKRILAFPIETKVEWKSHDSSIQQRTAIDEQRKEKSNQHGHHTSSNTPRNGNKDHEHSEKKHTS